MKIEVKENWTQVEAPGRDRINNNASYTAYYPDPVAQLWRRLKPSSFWVQNGYVADSAEYRRFCELGEKLETSVDPAERKAAWGEMLKVFSQNPWACPLYSLPMLYAKQKRLVQMVAEQEYEKEKVRNTMKSNQSNIVEFRNNESGLHEVHIRTITELLLRRLRKKTDRYPLTEADISLISTASAQQALGKINIPEQL